jgi:hypothetical protein
VHPLGLAPAYTRMESIMRTAHRIAASPSAYLEDSKAMNAALHQLYSATVSQAQEIVSELRETDRASIAVFCNGRAHMNAIGLAIAAQCSLDQLTAAAGSRVAGTTLFDQSRDPIQSPTRTCSYRRPITLAKSAPPRLGPRHGAGED